MRLGNPLATDQYQLTMAAGYFHRGMHEKRVSMELFVRRLPAERRFLLTAGLETALEHLRQLRFDESQIDYLKRVPALQRPLDFDLIEYLRDFRFRGDVWAMPEGTVAFAQEPLLRVTGSLFEAQLVETILLSIFNTETMIASKAARVVIAAGLDAQILEFGTRRTSPDEAVASARAAYLAGFSATSNVEAGYRYGIPLAGTAAHAWTMAHEDETEAFRAYADVFPDHSILLVDTYDTLEGTKNALTAAKDRLAGVRLDSGDLLDLSKKVRAMLDAAGRPDALIVGSGDLNEHRIAALRAAGAPIGAWGIGTELVRAKDAPSLGGVYKLVEDHDSGRKIAKYSDEKVTLPGVHQVFRVKRDGKFVRDVLGTLPEFHVDADPLLVPWMEGGRLVQELPSLAALRARAREQIASLPDVVRSLDPSDAAPYEVRLSNALEELAETVRARHVRSKTP